MSTALETLRFRLGTWEQISQACAAGNISPWSFLSFRPEKMRLRVGESFLRSQIPVIFADDLAERLEALLPPPTTPATPATPPTVADREALKRMIALA